MRAPSVIIIASPYEAELLGRSLGDTGLRVLRADGGDGAMALLATELPIAIVVGTSLLGADPGAIVTEARSRHESVALLLLADNEDPLVAELLPRVTSVFRRPSDFDALAHAIEQIAVDGESADLLEIVELVPASPPPPPLPRIRTHSVIEMAAELPLVRAHRTEVLSEGDAAVAAPAPAPAIPTTPTKSGDGWANLLRADEMLGEHADLGMDAMIPPPPMAPPQTRPRSFESRSTIAREIDRELSQAERRLFPDQTSSTGSFVHGADYEDALGDIDLDSLAIDTIPGLVQSLGMEEPRQRAPSKLRPATETATPAPIQRPVQEEGSLAELDVAELLARLHGNAFSGALHVTRPDGEKVVYLDQGEPVSARSTLRHDQLAELLFRDGKLARDQVARIRNGEGRAHQIGADGSARPVALRLVELGLLKESEVFPAIRRHAEELLFSLFALESGRYHLGPELPAADDRVRLPASMWALVFEGVRRKYGLERLSARVGGRDVVLRPTTLLPRVVESSGLSVDERGVAALLDGSRTLAEVRAALGGRIAESAVFAVAWALHVCGAAEVGGDGPVDFRDASTVITNSEVGERRARPRVTDIEQRAAEASVERERIASKSAQIIDADYFAILGVSRDASEHELRRAHARQCDDFQLSRFSAESAAGLREAIDDIRVVLDEALRVLLAAKVRERYSANLDPVQPDDDA